MACEGLRTCFDPGSYCPDNRYCLADCFTPPLDLRFNPGSFLAGIPNVPPVLETIFTLDCPMDTEIGVVISSQSGQSLYRTTDPIFNQRFRARLFVFQATTPGNYTVALTNTTFSPFITVSRNFATSWQAAGTVLNFTVAADQTGPMTLEVTTQLPQVYGSFDLALTCVSCIYAYWQLESFGPPIELGFNTTPDSAGARRLLVNPSATVVAGKIGNALNITGSLSGPSVDFTNNTFTFRFWFFPTATASGSNEEFVEHLNSFLTAGWRVYQRFDDSAGAIRVQLKGASGDNDLLFFSGYSLSAWHRLVVVYDLSALTLKVVLDNTKVTIGLVGIGISNVAGSFNIKKNDICSIYDEAGYWQGCAWTDAQIDFDWNSGAGKTYPDVPM